MYCLPCFYLHPSYFDQPFCSCLIFHLVLTQRRDTQPFCRFPRLPPPGVYSEGHSDGTNNNLAVELRDRRQQSLVLGNERAITKLPDICEETDRHVSGLSIRRALTVSPHREPQTAGYVTFSSSSCECLYHVGRYSSGNPAPKWPSVTPVQGNRVAIACR